ncbi:unnamed protein product [Paramecium pentaurelia]|uniref:Uncharacterized protein n=1 Tax=Paramecium pentaurelia TaxID=43138 RepID=A0A8S1UCA6_9CILI|nr:unnamed protein product [Paramecium pentaurelia]CAD8162472.1 unnamed protein product [Paramecium pentaurelia]
MQNFIKYKIILNLRCSGKNNYLVYFKQYLLNRQQNQENHQLYKIQNKKDIKLIQNQYNKQEGQCKAILFDKTKSIKVSNEIEQIKLLKFENRRLSLQSQLQNGRLHVKFIVYSKLINNFISSSADKQIICRIQVDINYWNSKVYKFLKVTINCFILNQREDQLISSRDDK